MGVIGRPFVKGVSGNPGGRPKGRSKVVEPAVKMSPGALRTLAAIMNDPDAEHADRIRAAEAILNRGLGKVAELQEEKRQAFADGGHRLRDVPARRLRGAFEPQLHPGWSAKADGLSGLAALLRWQQ